MLPAATLPVVPHPDSAGARPPGGEDGAAFEGQVHGSRGRPPILLVAFLAAVGTLVAIGLGGRDPGAGPSSAPGVGVATAEGSDARSSIGSPTVEPVQSPDRAPIVTLLGGPIELTARRHPETIYIHGDVYARDVTWMFVSLQDRSGRVAGWTSMSLPGAANPAADDGPSLRFDVELSVPADTFGGPLWVQANAHDSSGSLAATARLGIGADGGPLAEGATDAAPPDQAAAARAWAPRRDGDAIGEAPVRLETPRLGEPVVTARLTVTGTMRMRAHAVLISLRTSTNETIAESEVRTANVDGGIRPERTPVVDVRLDLPSPRPVGQRLWLVVAAFDELGRLVGLDRRAVEIGPLVAAT